MTVTLIKNNFGVNAIENDFKALKFISILKIYTIAYIYQFGVPLNTDRQHKING